MLHISFTISILFSAAKTVLLSIILLLGYFKMRTKSLLFWFILLVAWPIISLPLEYAHSAFMTGLTIHPNDIPYAWITERMSRGQFLLISSYGSMAIRNLMYVLGLFWLYRDLIRPRLNIRLSEAKVPFSKMWKTVTRSKRNENLEVSM